jgi:gluconokinase
MQVILALDIGSSSVRCSAYRIVDKDTTTTTPLEQCCRKIRCVQPNTGKIQLETEEGGSLLDEIDACVEMILQDLRQYWDFQVVGLGFSTFVMNLVGVDSSGNVVGQEATLSYACNSSDVVKECRNLRKELGEERLQDLYHKTGAPLHSAYALAQLRALYSKPQRIYKWQTIASLCLASWQGLSFLPISFSEASWTGLLNYKTCEWETDALDLLPLDCQEALPPLADYCDHVSGQIPEFITEGEKNTYWDRWPELREARLFLGLGDGACANVGSKCSTPSRVAVTVGTSAAARVCLPFRDDLRVPPGLFCHRLDKCHVLVGGALTDGGSVIEWASSLLNLNSEDAFQECMKQVDHLIEQEDCSSLSVVPFLSGERSTGFRDGATGCVIGLTRETTPARFLKGCMEGVMLRIKAILELMGETIEGTPYIVVSGNAMEKNAVWRQMLADASGMETVLDKDIQEGTSRGVARLIAIALQRETNSYVAMSEEPIPSPTVSVPRKMSTEGYWARATKEQDNCIDALSTLW